MSFIPVKAKLNSQHNFSGLQCHMILEDSFYAKYVLKKLDAFFFLNISLSISF